MLFLHLVLLAQATASPTITLEEALQRAAKGDPSAPALEARITAEEARGTFVGRRLFRSPEIGVSAERELETGRYAGSSLEIGASDEWDISGAPRRLRAAAESRARAGRLDVTSRASERSSQLIGAVLRDRLLERTRALQDELAASFDEVAQATGRRVGEGLAGATDAILARGEAASWRSEARATAAEAAGVRAEIAVLVDSKTPVVVTGDPVRGTLPAEVNRLLDRLDRHPDLLAFEERLQAARAEVEAAKAQRLPPLRVGIFASQERGGVPGDDFDVGAGIPAGAIRGFRDDDTSVGLQLAVPFPLTRGVRAEVLAATAELTSVEGERATRARELRAELQAAIAARVAADDRVKILEPLQDELPMARDRLTQAYREGRIDLESFMNRRDRLYEAANAYLEAVRDRDEADVRLARSLGGPWGLSLLPPEGTP